jgi:hypothetical protein
LRRATAKIRAPAPSGRLPNAVHAVRVERKIGSNDRQRVLRGVDDQHPVEWITVVNA